MDDDEYEFDEEDEELEDGLTPEEHEMQAWAEFHQVMGELQRRLDARLEDLPEGQREAERGQDREAMDRCADEVRRQSGDA